MENEGEVLRLFFKGQKESMGEISEMLTMTRQNLNYHLRKDVLDVDFKSKVVSMFGEHKNFPFSTLKTEKTKSNVSNFTLDNGKSNLFIVPLKAFGGFLTGYADTVFMQTLEKVSFPFVKGECFAFEVEGYSMFPEYNPNDYVVCTEVEDLRHLRKGQVYVFQTIDGLLLKVFERMDDEKIYLKSFNEEYNPVEPLPLKSAKRVYYKEYIIKK